MSRSAQMIGAAVIGGLVVGAVVWFARPPQPVAPVVPVESAQVTEQVPTQVAAPSSIASPAPWADAPPMSQRSIDLNAAVANGKVSPEKQAARLAIRNKIVALTANGRQPTAAEMTGVLGELEKIEGSSVISGINVGALRNNLVKVDEMQRLGEQMRLESLKPNGGDRQKLNSMMMRIQQLQSEMRLDIAVPPPAASAPVTTK